jgi:hypothetical protein
MAGARIKPRNVTPLGVVLLVASGLILGVQPMGHAAESLKPPAPVGGWEWDGNDESYTPQTIFDYIDGAGELYISYRFKRMSVRRYVRGGHPDVVSDIYEMGSSEDAYGIFSFEREDEEAGIGQGSEYGGGLLRFWKGQYFVSVYGEGDDPALASAILAIGRTIAETIVGTGLPPRLLAYLPPTEAGLTEKSVRFFHNHVCLNQRFFVANQNILNLGSETGGVIAQYQRDGSQCHLLLNRYPTDQLADAAVQSFKRSYMPEAGARDRLRTEDRRWTVLRREKDLVAVVFGASSEAEADALLAAVADRIKGG